MRGISGAKYAWRHFNLQTLFDILGVVALLKWARHKSHFLFWLIISAVVMLIPTAMATWMVGAIPLGDPNDPCHFSEQLVFVLWYNPILQVAKAFVFWYGIIPVYLSLQCRVGRSVLCISDRSFAWPPFVSAPQSQQPVLCVRRPHHALAAAQDVRAHSAGHIRPAGGAARPHLCHNGLVLNAGHRNQLADVLHGNAWPVAQSQLDRGLRHRRGGVGAGPEEAVLQGLRTGHRQGRKRRRERHQGVTQAPAALEGAARGAQRRRR